MKKKICFLLAILLILTLLCGCGATKSDSYESYSYTSNYAPAAPASAASGGWAKEAKADYDYAYDGGSPKEDYPETSTPKSTLPENVKLIYRANLSLESTEFDATVDGMNRLVADMGGYFENSYLENSGNYRRGEYTVRVPAQNFDAFCEGLGGLCQVNNINRSAEDVSEYYYDTESRLTTQKTKLARLQELLKQATDMEDIITLESAISDTELYIENLTGTLRKYDSLVGYSTISITLREVYKLTEIEQPVIGFWAKLGEAFRSGCSRFKNNLEDFLIGFARAWVGWLIFIIIVVVVFLLIRRGVRRRRAAREAGVDYRKPRKERRKRKDRKSRKNKKNEPEVPETEEPSKEE